jgi:hypothetical protein
MAIGKTHLDPFIQIVDLGGALGDGGATNYDDQVVSSIGAMQTTGDSLAANFQAVISQLNMLINGTKAGNDWYQALSAPVTFEGGAIRGSQSLNDDLHDLERKRILKRVSRVGVDIPTASAATGTLTSTGVNVSNGDTVTIDVKTYTFQTTLTNVDGNVQIGGSAALSLSNLAGAINLTGTPGTDYALATTIHPTVYSSAITATTLVGTAKTQGAGGNSIASTEIAVTLSWGAGTLAGGGSTLGGGVGALVLSPDQLPTATTAAIGAVTTLGLVCATAGTFGSSGLEEVAGPNPLQPKSLAVLVNSADGELLTDINGDQVFGLMQCQSAVDGSTITGIDPDQLQMSLVVRNGTNDDLVELTDGDLAATVTADFAYVRRDAFEDCPEEGFLSDGFTDGAAVVDTLESVYANQAGVAFTTLSSNTIDLGTGFEWILGDVLSADLFTVTEGSGGGTTTIHYSVDVDVADFDQVDTDFLNGITVGSAATGLEVMETAGIINRAAALTVQATGAAATFQTVTSGALNLISAGTADFQATDALTVDSSGGNILIGSDADDGNVSLGAGTTTGRTVAIGNLLGTTSVGISSGSGTISLATAALSAATADVTVATGDVTGNFNAGDFNINLGDVVGTGTGGGIGVSMGTSTGGLGGTFAVSGGDGSTVDGGIILSTGDTATTGADVALTASQDVTATATRDVILTSGEEIFFDSGACILSSVGSDTSDHIRDSNLHHYFGAGGNGQNFITLNAQANTTGLSGGTVIVSAATTYTPGDTYSATTATTFTVDAGAPVLSVGDYIIAVGSNFECINGLYVVGAIADSLITIDTTPTYPWFKTAIQAEATASGTLLKADLCVMRCTGSGTWEVADGDSDSATSFVPLATAAGSDFAATYSASTGDDPMFVVTAADSSFNIAGEIDGTVTVMGLENGVMTAATAQPLLNLAGDDLNSGDLFTITNPSDEGAASAVIGTSGDGIGLIVDSTGTGNIAEFRDGSTNIAVWTAAGGIDFDMTSGSSFTVDALGAGAIDFTTVTGGFTVTSSGSTGGTIANDIAVVNADNTAAAVASAMFTAEATGATAVTTSNLDVYSNVTSTSGTGNVNIQADNGIAGASVVNVNTNTGSTTNTSNFSTGVNTNIVTMGSITGPSSTALNAGTGNMTLTTSGAESSGEVNTRILITNTSDSATAVALGEITVTGSGGSAATEANLVFDPVVVNATGTATANLHTSGSMSGIGVVNVGTAALAVSMELNLGNGAPVTTANLGSVTTTSATNIAGGPSGSVNVGTTTATDINTGTGGFANTIARGNATTGTEITDTSPGAVAVNGQHGWIIQMSNNDPTSDTAVGTYEATAGFMAYNNSTFGDAYVSWGAGSDGYDSAVDTTSGDVHIVSITGAGTGTSVSFTAGIGPATNAPSITVGVGEGATFTVGNFIAVFSSANLNNSKIFRIAGIAADVLTLYGVGGTPVTEAWLASNVVGGADASAAVREVELSIWRQNAGVFEFAEGVTGGVVTYTTVASGNSTFQEVYNTSSPNTPSFTTTAADGPFAIAGTIDSVLADMATITVPTHTTPTPTTALSITGTPNGSGSLVEVNGNSTESGTAFQVNNLLGDGPGVAILNTSSSHAFRCTDGILNHLTVGADGGFTVIPDSGADVTFTGSGAASAFETDGFETGTVKATSGTATTSTMLVEAENTSTGDATVTVTGSADGNGNTGTVTVLAESTNVTAGTATLNLEAERAGAGGGAITINMATTQGAAVNVGTGPFTQTAMFNTGAGVKSTTLGSENTSSDTTINAGSGDLDLNSGGNFTIDSITDSSITQTTAGGTAVLTFTVDNTGAAGVANLDLVATASNAAGGTPAVNIDATSALIGDPGVVNIQTQELGTVNVATGTVGANTANILTGVGVDNTLNVGNADADTTLNWTAGSSTAAAAEKGWTYNFPNKFLAQATQLDRNDTVAPGVARHEVSSFYLENQNEGNVALFSGTGNDAGVATNNYTISVVSSDTVDEITSFTNNGAATNPTAVLTTGGLYSVGEVLLVTDPGGSTFEENRGLFVVAGIAGTALTLDAAPGAGFEFFNNQVTSQTGLTATVRRATITAERVDTTGEVLVARAFNDIGLATYVNIVTAGGDLVSVVATTGGSSATQGSVSGDSFEWFINDAEFLEWSSATGGHRLLRFAPAVGADIVNIGEANLANGVTIAGGTAGILADATGPVSLDSTATASNFTITGAASSTLTLKTDVTTNGDLATTRLEAINSNGTAGSSIVSVQALRSGVGGGSATINIGEENSATLNLGTGAFTQAANFNTGAGIKTTTIGSTNTTSLTTVDGGTLGLDLNSTGSLTADGVGACNFTATSGNNTFATLTTGNVILNSVDSMDIDAGAAIDMLAVTTISIEATTAMSVDAGTTMAFTTANAADASGNIYAVTTGDSTAGTADGPDIRMTPGDGFTTGAHGEFQILGVQDNDEAFIALAATGGGSGNSKVYAGDTIPTHTAPGGSLFCLNTGAGATGNTLYVQIDASGGGDDGSTWEPITTSGTAVTKNFFQDTITGAGVGPSGNLSASDFTGGVIAVKPTTDFDFNFDAQIYLNGLLLMNAGGDVSSGVGNTIDVSAAGPTFSAGDVVTISYTQNATNTTA